MAWKAETGEQTVSIPKSEIKWAQWLRVARNFQLRVGKANHQTVTFDGFMREVLKPAVFTAQSLIGA